MLVPTGSVHAHILAKPSRAGFVVSRSDLVEPGAATCVFRGMARPCFKSLGRQGMKYDNVFLVGEKILPSERAKSNSGPTECVPFFGRFPETCCKL